MPPCPISLSESLWVRGEAIDRTQRNSWTEADGLRPRSAKILSADRRRDMNGLERLQHRSHKDMALGNGAVTLAKLQASPTLPDLLPEPITVRPGRPGCLQVALKSGRGRSSTKASSPV